MEAGAEEPDGNVALSARDRAILAAVAAGSAELVCGAEPDLFVDGRSCSDQPAVHRLVRAGLIAPATHGVVAQRVRAAVTPAGERALRPALAAAG